MGTGGRSDVVWSFMAHVKRLPMAGMAVCLMAVAGVADESSQAQEPPKAATPEVAPKIEHPQLGGPCFSRVYRGVTLHVSEVAAAAQERIDAALDRVLEEKVEFSEAPLSDVAMMMQTLMEVPVRLDQKALDDAGIAPDTPVTESGQGVTARSLLRKALRNIDLTYMVRSESLLITTKEKADTDLDVVVYPLPYGMDRGPRTDLQPLIDLIQNTIVPPSWDTQGGPGAIRPFDSSGEPLLVVSQSTEIHDEVKALLSALHARALAEFGGEGEEARPVTRVHHVDDEQLRGELAERLAGLVNATLAEGQDDEAVVEAVGTSLVIRSKSPGFHVRATQMIDAIQGVEVVPRPTAGMGVVGGGF